MSYEIIEATDDYFAVEFPKSYFSEILKKLETRWEKYIALKRDYVKK